MPAPTSCQSLHLQTPSLGCESRKSPFLLSLSARITTFPLAYKHANNSLTLKKNLQIKLKQKFLLIWLPLPSPTLFLCSPIQPNSSKDYLYPLFLLLLLLFAFEDAPSCFWTHSYQVVQSYFPKLLPFWILQSGLVLIFPGLWAEVFRQTTLLSWLYHPHLTTKCHAPLLLLQRQSWSFLLGLLC